MRFPVGAVLRAKRREQKLTLRELSEKTGIGYSMLSKYENGVVQPREENLLKIADALGIQGDFAVDLDAQTIGIPTTRLFTPTFVNGFSELDGDALLTPGYVADVEREVLAAANGICEFCGTDFHDIPGFLDAHFVIWLRDGGSPSKNNAVALCPNCHKRAHCADEPDFTRQLLIIAGKRK